MSILAGAFPVFGPAKFDCVISPRSEAAAALVSKQADVNRPEGLEDASIYDELCKKLQA
jgi:hypothetical protein